MLDFYVYTKVNNKPRCR